MKARPVTVTIRRGGALTGQRSVEIVASGSKLGRVTREASILWATTHGADDEARDAAEQLRATEGARAACERQLEAERDAWEPFARDLAGAIGEQDGEIFDAIQAEPGGARDLPAAIVAGVTRRIVDLLAVLTPEQIEAFNNENGTLFDVPGKAPF